jgi:hypothetical protein
MSPSFLDPPNTSSLEHLSCWKEPVYGGPPQLRSSWVWLHEGDTHLEATGATYAP